ncbi:amino acid permease/ SLC12A domain-containing protein [Ilyonectria robusta]|uniref:amino acid permease/ SLC12A domain-containing protein n=1 Tax=Ilyonectria robusta TaxID=1079257 RepID=UPI001E8DF9B9|nr:amino acid permease/ SLC12A domain-containing protein [Ilyonectria robusta]KAH8733973.1 amino acid permease/ SLC12A domain-containing protein [Ilyonectria robusta]
MAFPTEVHHGKEGGIEEDPVRLAAVTSYTDGDVEPAGSRALGRTETHRGIKSRHSQMIAIGGTIGTGLFVGTGQALATAGPANLFLAYIIICFFVYGIVTATSEISSYLPTPGSSMASNGSRYVSKSLGFAMGYLYWYSFSILVAYEVTAAALVINYWPNSIHIAVWITIMLAVIIFLNMAPVGIYAESEFWFASVKVFMIIGLLLLAVILAFGGGPSGQRLGFTYWNNPGPMNEYLVDGAGGRFCSFVYALTFSTFSFAFGPELIVLTGGEMRAPRKNLPRAAKSFIWRLIFFYVLGALAIGIICRSDAPGLTNGGSGAAASPWVIGIKEAGIKTLDSVINAGIILSAWSSGNSFLYMSSRSLYSLSKVGNAPAIFSRCNRWGVPIYAVLASTLFAPLAYLNVGSSTSLVFNWLINLTTTAGFNSWMCCCIIFLRFRMACKAQGVTNVPYQSVLQPYISWACLVFFTAMLLLNGFGVFFPGNWSVSSFLTSYIGLPIFIVIYLSHRIYSWNESWAIEPSKVDLHTGLDELLALEEMSSEVNVASNGKLRKILRSLWE